MDVYVAVADCSSFVVLSWKSSMKKLFNGVTEKLLMHIVINLYSIIIYSAIAWKLYPYRYWG